MILFRLAPLRLVPSRLVPFRLSIQRPQVNGSAIVQRSQTNGSLPRPQVNGSFGSRGRRPTETRYPASKELVPLLENGCHHDLEPHAAQSKCETTAMWAFSNLYPGQRTCVGDQLYLSELPALTTPKLGSAKVTHSRSEYGCWAAASTCFHGPTSRA